MPTTCNGCYGTLCWQPAEMIGWCCTVQLAAGADYVDMHIDVAALNLGLPAAADCIKSHACMHACIKSHAHGMLHVTDRKAACRELTAEQMCHNRICHRRSAIICVCSKTLYAGQMLPLNNMTEEGSSLRAAPAHAGVTAGNAAQMSACHCVYWTCIPPNTTNRRICAD